MFLMAAEILRVPQVAESFPDNYVWQCVAFHTQHVEWTGCSLHDLIQPSFSFMVGVALPFSLASRAMQGQSRGRQWLHALWRSLLLVLLGVFLRSVGEKMTNWTFEDTLSQIGLGYPFLFALGLAGARVRWATLGVILAGYWLFFALYTTPPGWTAEAAAGPPGWAHDFTGFLAHWNLNHNAAWQFDRWFMNLFARESAFQGNDGGYSTLSFIPTLGTMLLGLIAGQWLKDRPTPSHPLRPLVITGVACLALGWVLELAGICPSIKKIWTPAWTLVSGGWCLLFMAAFYAVVDVRGWRWGVFPLVVIGMNSIAMYVMVHLFEGFISSAVHTHLGNHWEMWAGQALSPLLHGSAVLLVLWLILLWMHRRKLHLRV